MVDKENPVESVPVGADAGRPVQVRELLEIVVDAVPAAVVVLRGRDLRCTLVNRVARAVVYDRDLLGHTVADLWPEMAGKVMPLLSAVLASGNPFHAEDMPFSLDGDGSGPGGERYFSITCERLPEDAQGRPGILVTGIETTGAVLGRRAQVASEARYRSLVEHAPDIIYSYSDRRGGLYYSPRVEEVLGHTPQYLLDHPFLWQESIHFEDAPRVAAAVKGLESGQHFQVEYRVRDRSGGWRWLLDRSIGLSSGGDEIVIDGLATDITERKQGEEELRRLAAAVEQAPASIVITDQDGRIQYVNPAFEKLTGYSRQEAIGQKPSILKSGKQDDEFYRNLWATISGGQVWTGRIANLAKGGRLFTETAVIAPVRDLLGEIRSYVAVKRDITSELETQRQLDEVLKLESVGRLAGGIAHDFNNLLTIILGGTESLKEDLRGTGAACMEVVDDMRAAGERARDLTGKLLAFARRQVIEPVPLNLNNLIRDSEKLLRRLLREDIVLAVNLQPNLWTTRLDPSQVEQVLLNLAVNGGDAMPSGGRLTIETANFQVTGAFVPLHPGIEPGHYVRMIVQDSGTGMAPEVVARIFEPFFTTKPIGRGTGLGLSTVYGIVKQSGGFIRVESAPGYGSSFELLFPRVPDEEVDRTKEAASRPAGGTETILLVEDDHGVRKIALRALRSAGYQVLDAASGAEALEILARHEGPLDLLLTDVVMPGADGGTVAEEARRRRPSIRVLFVSGHGHEVLALHGVLPEHTELLPKPYTPATLLERARRVLDRTDPK
jgi:PAS domain S-box-containing protein